MKSQSEPPIDTAQSNGEEIGLLAAEAAVHQFEANGPGHPSSHAERPIQAPHDRAEPWPDLPGVGFAEPYSVDIPWLMGLPRGSEEEISDEAEHGELGSTTALDLDDLEELEQEKTFIELDRDELDDAEIQSVHDELRTTQPDLAAITEVPADDLTDLVDAAVEEELEPSGLKEHPSSAPPIPMDEIERFEQESTFILLEGDDVEVLETEEATAVEPSVESRPPEDERLSPEPDRRPSEWERRDTHPGTKAKADLTAGRSPRKEGESLDELELDPADIEEVVGKPLRGAVQRLQQHTPPLPVDAQREWVEKGSTREMIGLHKRAGVEEAAEASSTSSSLAKVLPLARPLNLRQHPEPKFTLPQPSVEDAFHMGYAGRELDPFEELALPEAVRAKAIPRARPWYEVIFDGSYFEILPPKLHQQTRREARLVYDTLRLQSRAQVLDMACGFGRHCFELVKLGYQMTGIDLSPALIEKARAQAEQRQTHIDFRVGDMRDFDMESAFDGAILLGDSFGYFDDQSNADVLENIYRSLKPKGRFLLDVMNRDRILAEIPRVSWWRGGNCLVLEEVEFDFNFSRMMSKRTLLFEDGRPPWEQFIDLRIYSLHELVDIVESAGFRVCEITGSTVYPGLFFGRESRRIIVLGERS